MAKQAVVYPGIMPRDDVDRERFHSGPQREVLLKRWDRQVVCDVYREDSDHQVYVQHDIELRWWVHVSLLVVIGVITALCGVFSAMSWMTTLALVVVVVLLSIGVLVVEDRRFGSQGIAIAEVYSGIDSHYGYIIDSAIWEGIKSVIKRNFDAVTSRDDTDSAHSTAGLAHDMDGVVQELVNCFKPSHLVKYHERLAGVYNQEPQRVAVLGSGHRECSCQACHAVRLHGLDIHDTSTLSTEVKKTPQRITVGVDSVVK